MPTFLSRGPEGLTFAGLPRIIRDVWSRHRHSGCVNPFEFRRGSDVSRAFRYVDSSPDTTSPVSPVQQWLALSEAYLMG